MKRILLNIVISSCALSVLYRLFIFKNGIIWGYAIIPASIIASVLVWVFDYLMKNGESKQIIRYILKSVLIIILFIATIILMIDGKTIISYLTNIRI